MREFRQRREVRRMLYSHLSLFVLFILLLLVARSAFAVYKKEVESGEKRAQAEAALQKLQERKIGLEKSIESLQTPEGIEREIRENYRMARPGEELTILTEAPIATTTDSVETGFFQTIFNKIKGKH